MSYISFYKPEIGQEEITEVTNCLLSGWLTTGSRCKQFEEDFAKYMGVGKFAIAVNSCTAALHLALEAMDLKENDIVIVPTMTFAATAEVVRYFKAIPILVDCNENDFCINLDHAEEILEKLSKGKSVPGLPKQHGPVRGIMPVHFSGQAIDVTRCQAIAKKYNLFIVEDCAHCCPAYYKDENNQWKMVGSSADIACYSFYANKTITTGEGGMSLTNNEKWADRMRVMSLHGLNKDAWKRFSKGGSWYNEIIAPGYKYNLTDLAASIGIHQLKKANKFWQRRKEISKQYAEKLKNTPGIILPTEQPDRQHSWHLYIIRVDKTITCIGRNEFIEQLKEQDVGTAVHYMPLHLHSYYKENFNLKPEHFPVANKIFEQIISLPIYPSLTSDEVNTVCTAIKKIATQNTK